MYICWNSLAPKTTTKFPEKQNDVSSAVGLQIAVGLQLLNALVVTNLKLN